MVYRDQLEASAAKGNKHAIAKLEGPDRPECLDYLFGWLYELHGRSGVGMNGFAPLSYSTIDSWAKLTGNRPTQLDVQALIELDSVLLYPESGEGEG